MVILLYHGALDTTAPGTVTTCTFSAIGPRVSPAQRPAGLSALKAEGPLQYKLKRALRVCLTGRIQSHTPLRRSSAPPSLVVCVFSLSLAVAFQYILTDQSPTGATPKVPRPALGREIAQLPGLLNFLAPAARQRS